MSYYLVTTVKNNMYETEKAIVTQKFSFMQHENEELKIQLERRKKERTWKYDRNIW